jgi:predicted esterase
VVAQVRDSDLGPWRRQAEDWFFSFPSLASRLRDLKRRLEDLEQETDNALRRSSIWTALMRGELILQRLRTMDDPNIDARFVESELEELVQATAAIEKNQDPYQTRRGHVVRGYRSACDDRLLPYSVYIPEKYSDERVWPLVVMLHGAWSNHFLAMRRVFGFTNAPGEPDVDAKKTKKPLLEIDFLVVCPNGRETQGYRGIAERDVWDVLEMVKLGYRVDEDRISITGLSMGGRGTADLALRYPDVFAAAAPVCGFFEWQIRLGSPSEQQSRTRATLSKAQDLLSLAENARHVAFKLGHGAEDPVVDVEHSRRLHARLQELRYTTEYEEYPGVGHDAWAPAYRDARVFDWFRPYKRVSRPADVVYRTTQPRGGSAYWISIDALMVPRTLGEVVAHADRQSITVCTDNVEAFSIDPTRLPDSVELPATVTANGVSVGKLAGHNLLSFAREGNEFVRTKRRVTPGLLPGVNGLKEAILDAHAYVYSTEGSLEEQELTRALAAWAADWGDWADVRWPVVSDREVPTHRNLVVFGTPSGNRLLTKVAGRLPIHFEDNALVVCGKSFPSDHACRMIFPNPDSPDRYLLVNTAVSVSGLSALQGGGLGVWPSWRSEPDVIVVGPDGKEVWSALFDREWKIWQTSD